METFWVPHSSRAGCCNNTGSEAAVVQYSAVGMITTGKDAHLPGCEHLQKRRDAGEVVRVNVNVQLDLHLQRRGTVTSTTRRAGSHEQCRQSGGRAGGARG
eukprot:1134635-Pelagomonas_calceolata.AAC.5